MNKIDSVYRKMITKATTHLFTLVAKLVSALHAKSTAFKSHSNVTSLFVHFLPCE